MVRIEKPEGVKWDTFKQTCPTRQVLDCIADKWAVLVVGALVRRQHRFGELQRVIEGVSQKMLTQTLRALERDGIVRRIVHASVPPRVDYELTALGQSLANIVENLRSWSEANIEQVLESREEFDHRDT